MLSFGWSIKHIWKWLILFFWTSEFLPGKLKLQLGKARVDCFASPPLSLSHGIHHSSDPNTRTRRTYTKAEGEICLPTICLLVCIFSDTHIHINVHIHMLTQTQLLVYIVIPRAVLLPVLRFSEVLCLCGNTEFSAAIIPKQTYPLDSSMH